VHTDPIKKIVLGCDTGRLGVRGIGPTVRVSSVRPAVGPPEVRTGDMDELGSIRRFTQMTLFFGV
jgi:hypothetical protein